MFQMAHDKPILLSRRALLKGLGVGAGAFALGSLNRPQVARAQTTGSTAAVVALNRFNLGDMVITMIQDGAVIPFPPSLVAVNAETGEIEEISDENNLPFDRLYGGYNIALVESGDQLILLDAGNGPGAVESGNGRLAATLELISLTPEDITAVVFSHYHPDHINGAFAEGSLLYPNAMHYFPQPEYDFLMNATNIPADFQAIVDAAKALLTAAEASDNLTLFPAEGEILAGINAVPAPGHTPGHTAILLSSGDAQLLGTFDTAISAVYSLERPDFVMGFDADPQMAVETRRALFGRAADESLQVFGYHFPFPGVGQVVREGDGFRFVPAV
jgi:glyoxylase-like metal-dependent hydrolase (beta-lactamase superfamily II)